MDLTKCDTDERNEKCHYTSDILSECPRGYFVVLLSYSYNERCLPRRNLATILPFKSKLFQCY